MLLSYDDTWKALIAHYDERKCVQDTSVFPSKKDLAMIA